jgi:hypothetical protein
VVKDNFDRLAQGNYPKLELFHRITVNGGLPLAAWLQEKVMVMGVSRNVLADINPPRDKNGGHQTPVPVSEKYQEEAVDGDQMSYFFTVLYTAGVDAKFSLISPRWNPLAADLSASMVQTGVVSLYVNGYMTQPALGAKVGVVGIAGRIHPAPQQVVVLNGYPNPSRWETLPSFPPVRTEPPRREAPPQGPGPAVPPQGPSTQAVPPAQPQRPARQTRRPTGPNRGQLLAPAAPFVLSPGP